MKHFFESLTGLEAGIITVGTGLVFVVLCLCFIGYWANRGCE